MRKPRRNTTTRPPRTAGPTPAAPAPNAASPPPRTPPATTSMRRHAGYLRSVRLPQPERDRTGGGVVSQSHVAITRWYAAGRSVVKTFQLVLTRLDT